MKEERKETSGLSRRAFLQGASLAAVAAAGMGVVGCAPTSTSSEKGAAESSANASLAGTGSQEVAWAYHSESPVWALEEVGEPTETVQAELVIIGDGGPGMSAAIQAKQLGMEPVVLEKMAVAGGSFSACEGVFAANSHWQKEQGFNYTAMEFVEDTMTYHHYTVQEDLVRKFFERTGETIQWMEDQGIEFDFIQSQAGSRTAWHIPKGKPKPGPVMCQSLIDATVANDVEIQYETPAKSLVLDGEGAVEGVIAQRSDGTVVKYETSAVLICTGGYNSNEEFMKYINGLEPEIWTNFGTPGHDADGIKMAHGVGADLCRFPGTVNASGLAVVGISFGTPLFAATMQPFCLGVNGEGERYLKEDLMAANFCAAGQAAMSQPGPLYAIFPRSAIDQLESGSGTVWGNGVFTNVGDTFPTLTQDIAELSEETVVIADTISELADKLGMDATVLQATVDRYNELCEKVVDEDYNKAADYLYACDEGPFYAFHQTLMMAFTVGGLKIDVDNRVIGRDGEPIAGLYASGCDAGGLYGECYDYNIILGSQGAWAVNSGRMAAESIKEYLG